MDSEQRLVAARVIKRSVSLVWVELWHDCAFWRHCRFILHAKKTAFVVEHDFIMATYLADRVIVFEGVPSMRSAAKE